MSKQRRFSSFLTSLGLSAATAPLSTAPQGSADPGDEDEGQGEPDATETVPAVQAEAAVNAALAKGKLEGRKEGFAAANERMVAVLGSDVGKRQPAAAVALLARAPDMSADDAIATLAELSPAAPEAPKGGADAIGADLNLTPKPDAGAKPGSGEAQDDEQATVSLWDGVQGTKNGQKITTLAAR